MADFQASLLDTNSQYDITYDQPNNTLIITETSNYSTSDQAGNEDADFTLFKKLIVTDPNNAVFLFSSIGDGDESIDAGSAQLEFTYPINAGDGVYQVRLITLPTWNSGDTYVTGQYLVQLNGGDYIVYKLLTASSLNESPVDNPSVWEVVTDITTIAAQWNVLGYAVLIPALQEAKITAVNNVASDFTTENWNSLLTFPDFVKAAKLDMVIKSIINKTQQGLYTTVSQLVTEGTAIATC